MKKILSTIFCSALMLGIPTMAYANTAIEIVDNDFQSAAISITRNTLHVTGANGQMLYIFNVAGVRVMTFKVEGNDKFYDLNLPHGCYIIKVGKTVRKVSIS